MVHNQRCLQTFCGARSPHRSTAGVLEVSLHATGQAMVSQVQLGNGP